MQEFGGGLEERRRAERGRSGLEQTFSHEALRNIDGFADVQVYDVMHAYSKDFPGLVACIGVHLAALLLGRKAS